METRKVQLGSVITNIARLDNGIEVIPMPEVCLLLGVEVSNVSEHLMNLSGHTGNIPADVVRSLKSTGFIPSGRGRPPRLVTKEEFQFLVKKVNTPQAWGVYQALWGMVEQQVKAADEGMPPWALQMQQNLTERFERIEDISRGLRDEVDELRATLNLLISEDDEKTIRTLIKRIKDAHNCDGRKVVGMVRATLNVASIYDTPDTRKVINVLKNILGEGLTLVKEP
jgi:hypothetical protein